MVKNKLFILAAIGVLVAVTLACGASASTAKISKR